MSYSVSEACNKITQIFCDPLFSNVREVGRDLSILSHSHNTCASVRFGDTMDTGLVISQPSGLETMLGFPSTSTDMQVVSDLKELHFLVPHKKKKKGKKKWNLH